MDLKQQFNDEVEQYERRHDPRGPRRHKRLVKIQTNEYRRHYTRQIQPPDTSKHFIYFLYLPLYHSLYLPLSHSLYLHDGTNALWRFKPMKIAGTTHVPFNHLPPLI